MIESRNKFTGSITRLAENSEDSIKKILKKTGEFFPQWRFVPVPEKIERLKNLRRVLKDREEEIVRVVRAETGKPVQDFLFGEMTPVHNLIKFLCRKELRDLLENGEKVWGGPFFFQREKRIIYEPIGRIAVISSWNFPFSLAIGDSLEALIGGNVVILKHSSYTPLTSLLIDDLLKEAGFPENVFHTVLGPGSKIGKLLAERVEAVALTGSIETGQQLKEIADKRGIHFEAELGGSNPAIVLEEANLERAANAVVWGRNMNTGQACNSIKRVYVEASIYRKFVDMVVEKVGNLILGKDYGPVIDQKELNKLRDFLRDAGDKGARVKVGGEIIEDYLRPAVLTNVNHSMRIMQEECFGPIMPIMKVKDYKQALKLANDSPFGLGASVFMKKKDSRLKHIIHELDVGIVNVNSVMDEFAVIGLPFVGRKQSGYGSGRHSLEGVKRFLRAKGVLISSGWMKKETQWYPYSPSQIKTYKIASKLGLI